MKHYQVVITPFAEDNIRTAHEWLVVENPVYAAKWFDNVRKGILDLEILPESHAIAPESEAFDCEIRQLLVGKGTPWRIFFTIDESKVYILHIRHGRRNYWQP
ncbi:MAG: type II toxin-antitoxin system RelE/ParE family toxin [Magnetococcales bacterium]|nr:type II toxin-antitoxin system RelE/ParE family toxin [Magnetococcales bacterium]